MAELIYHSFKTPSVYAACRFISLPQLIEAVEKKWRRVREKGGESVAVVVVDVVSIDRSVFS
jgi:hypothetical protein